jgi:Ser/Thr protein kinase RdoA (MazF antagonist)
MERHISTALTPEVLASACARWGMDRDHLQLIRAHENFVYATEISGHKAVLRLTHTDHRSRAELEWELAFINSLAAAQLPACTPIPSSSGSTVEAIGDAFNACCFHFATGSPARWRNPAIWNEGLFKEWGRVLARFHHHAETTLADRMIGRPLWHQGDFLVNNYLDSTDSDIFQRLKEFIEELQQLPIGRECFGLIHADFHQGNFFASETGELSVFDFDDCNYHWYANDFAVIWYHLPEGEAEVPPNPKREQVMRSLLDGYRQVRALPSGVARDVNRFLLLRDFHMYQALYKKFGPDDRSAWWKSETTLIAQRIRSRSVRIPFPL